MANEKKNVPSYPKKVRTVTPKPGENRPTPKPARVVGDKPMIPPEKK